MAATWDRLDGVPRSVKSVQALTEAAPLLDTDGVKLTGVDAVVPVLTAPQGQTFTGSGFLRAYLYSEKLQRWIRAPRADENFADLVGLAEGVLPALPVVSPAGRFAYICDSVGLSGGAAVTLTLLCAAVRDGGPI